MEDIRSVLSSHHPKSATHGSKPANPMYDHNMPTSSEIPDLFFDEILVKFKLTRVEILCLMYLYRSTWSKPNLHRKYGIAPIVSHNELAIRLDISNEILHQTIRRLEGFDFIETIRSGQYFVRKFFTETNDRMYGQTYDNFL